METHILLFVVSVVATAINSVAGGGGLLTFPVLMTVLPPVIADATSAVALLPAYMTSKHLGGPQASCSRAPLVLATSLAKSFR